MGHHASHCCSTPQCMAVAFVSKVEAHRSECLLRSHCLLELLPKSLVFTVKMCKSASNYCWCLSHKGVVYITVSVMRQTASPSVHQTHHSRSISFKCLNVTNENKISLFLFLFFSSWNQHLCYQHVQLIRIGKKNQEKSISGSTGRIEGNSDLL